MRGLFVAAALIAATAAAAAAAPAKDSTGDTALAGFTAVYKSLADSIVANKHGEDAVIRGLLGVHRDLALAALDRARAAGSPSADLRAAAAHAGDFATEGGSVIEPIRTRLLDAGHHHHADDTGPDAAYDTGYVILTKKQKVEALDLAKRCARSAEAAKGDAAEIGAIRDALAGLAARVLQSKR